MIRAELNSVYETPGVAYPDGSSHLLNSDLSADSLRSLLIVNDGNRAIDEVFGRPIIVGKDRPAAQQ